MIAYRDAVPDDGPALDAMAQVSWIETFGPELAGHDLSAYLAEAHGPNGRLLADLGRPEVDFRLAIADGAIVGYAKLRPRTVAAPDPDAAALEIAQIYVLKPWHGDGVGHMLMAWCYATATARAAPELYLSVYEHNARARAFYAREGWEEVGEIEFRVGTRLDRDLVLRRRL